MQVIVRRPDAEHAPAIRFPAKRISDFALATETICKADSLDEIVHALLRIAATQFLSWHCWCALRGRPDGPMTCHAGKQRDGRSVELSDIRFSDKITEAIDTGRFLLIPRVPAQRREERMQSVMIAPIMDQAGCFGVIYIDNAPDHEHYTISDLDYLILLAIHTAVILENF
jgi:GAF domain-containing protein